MNKDISMFCQIWVQMGASKDDPIWNSYIVHNSDVPKMVQALKELHYQPGINPHNGRKTSPLWEIRSNRIVPRGPFWWTSPGLQKDTDGAVLYGDECPPGEPSALIWRHPDLDRRYQICQEEMLRQEKEE